MTRRSLLQFAPALLTAAPSKTRVEIRKDQFFINGQPTYKGRFYKGHKIEGLLMNSRMVQGIFDDKNPATVSKWAYPDTRKWDAERNVKEFLAAMPVWRKHGLLSFTINLQGGSPEGYSKTQPWFTSGIAPDGTLLPDFMARLKRILDRAGQLGMIPIVGYFYFGQDQVLKDEGAVRNAVVNATNWLLDQDYRNILVEVDNETNVKAYDHEILKPARVHELIELVKGMNRNGRRLLTGTSYGGNGIPESNVVKSSDFLLIHGNGVKDPKRIAEMVRLSRAVEGYKPMPILFNEDDHFDFDKPENNMMSAISEYASWGYFDPGASDYADGYQCPPVNWGINSERKKAFFNLLRQVTGS